MNEPELAVVGVAGAIGVVAQRQVLGKPGQGGVRVLVVNWVGVVPRRGPNAGEGLRGPRAGVLGLNVGVVGE